MTEALLRLKGLRVATEDRQPPLRGISLTSHKEETNALDPRAEASRQ